MKTVSKILVPVDFSKCSKAALEAAVLMARTFNASIEVLHVNEPQNMVGHVSVQVPGRGEMVMADYLRDQAAKMLDTMIAVLEFPVTRTLRTGLAESLIVEYVKEGGHDLLVMGTHGRTGFRHLLMGSVTERVLRQSPVPVLVVRAPQDG